MSAAGDPLAQRIERVCADTWPAIEQWDYDGWVLRFARGYTKRANSVTAAAEGAQPLAVKIAACAAAYAARHIAPVFRLPSTVENDALDAALQALSYAKIDKTSIRVMALDGALPEAQATLSIAPGITEEWMDCQARWNGLDPDRRAAFQAIAGGIRERTAFALLEIGSEPAAAGIAVLQQDLVRFHAIITAPEARRRGYGRVLTAGLLRWGQAHGAAMAYLQVVKSNAAALRLYNELGFAREVYRYHYRARA